MREVNRSIIYDLIRDGGEISRTDLAKISSLTKPTVSTIVEELLSEGIVSEVGFSKSEPTGGRRARLLRFNPDSAAYVGVRFGVQSTTVALSDGLGRVQLEREVPALIGDASASVDSAVQALTEMLVESGVPKSRVHRIGIAVGGLVEAESGNCILSPNLEWKDVALRELAEKAFETPAEIFNVTEAAASAESKRGATREIASFVWVYAGTGIGSAITFDGQVMRGSSGFTGEIGFCRMSEDGPILEEVASGRVILEEAIVQKKKAGAALGPDVTVDEVLRLSEEGDVVCRGVVEEAGRALGLALAHLVNITNPELVVVGGGVGERSPAFVEAANAAVKTQALGPEVVPVVATELPGRAVTTGAVLLAMETAVKSIRIVTRA